MIVDGCGLCLLQKRTNGGRTVDNNSHNNHALVELVVGDASSPSRSDRGTPSLNQTTPSLVPSSSPTETHHQRHDDHSKHQSSTIDDDDGYRGAIEYACNLIDTRPVSALGPKIHSVVAGVLSPTSSSSSSSSTGLFRYALRRIRQQQQQQQQSSNHATHDHMTSPMTAEDFEYIDITNTRSSTTSQVFTSQCAFNSNDYPTLHSPPMS